MRRQISPFYGHQIIRDSMRHSRLATGVLIFAMITACNSVAPVSTQLSSPASTSQIVETAVGTPVPTRTVAPSASVTPSAPPTQTFAPTSKPTQTLTPTPTPITISRANWQNLTLQQVYGDGEIRNIVWSSDGNMVAVGFTHSIHIYHSTPNGLVENLRISSAEQLSNIQISPDGKMVGAGAYMSWDKPLVRFWDAGTGRILKEFTDFKYSPTEIAFSTDGTLVAVTSPEDIHVWQLDGWKQVSATDNVMDAASPLVFAAGNRNIVARMKHNGFTSHGIQVWPIGLDSLTTLTTDDLDSFAVAPNGTTLVLGMNSSEVVVRDGLGYQGVDKPAWKAFSSQDVACNPHPGLDCLRLALSHDGSTVFTRLNQDTSNRYAANAVVAAWTLDGHSIWSTNVTGHVNQIAVSPDDSVVSITIHSDQEERLEFLDARTGVVKNTIEYPHAVACSTMLDLNHVNIGKVMSSIWGDTRIAQEYPIDNGGFTNYLDNGVVAISPDGKFQVHFSVDHTDNSFKFEVFQAPNNSGGNVISYKSEKCSASNHFCGMRGIAAAAFSRDSKFVTLAANLHLLTYDLATGTLISDVPTKATSAIVGLTYTPDGGLIASDSDGRIELVDPQSSSWLGFAPIRSDDGGAIVIKPDGSQIASAYCGGNAIGGDDFAYDQIVMVWGLNP